MSDNNSTDYRTSSPFPVAWHAAIFRREMAKSRDVMAAVLASRHLASVSREMARDLYLAALVEVGTDGPYTVEMNETPGDPIFVKNGDGNTVKSFPAGELAEAASYTEKRNADPLGGELHAAIAAVRLTRQKSGKCIRPTEAELDRLQRAAEMVIAGDSEHRLALAAYRIVDDARRAALPRAINRARIATLVEMI